LAYKVKPFGCCADYPTIFSYVTALDDYEHMQAKEEVSNSKT
jgi:hypothetical protein